MEKRIDELEIKFMVQEDLLDQLNKIVTDQQFAIEKLQKQIQAMKNHMDSSESGEARDLKDEIPPHY